jgi:hypothetical protein
MAVSYNPSIVRDGLVVHLDAANTKSLLKTVEVLVVGGGGGGGTGGGGGGAGGLLYSSSYSVTPGSAITVTVGNGGTGTSTWGGNGTNGGNSVFGALTAVGGGAGGHRYSGSTQGTGGSGGGNAGGTSGSGTVIMANGTSGQGFTGGSSIVNGSTQEEPGGGGGGAGGRGADSIIPANTTNAAANSALPGAGGVGLRYDISGTPTYYAGGGGGSNRNGVGASGGLGGGGAGGTSPVAGTNGLGGGGGGTGFSGYGGGGTSAVGGSGVVIVRYPGSQKATGGTITSVGGYTIHTFTSVGSTTFTPNATWYDMSLSGYHGTLTNGPTYNNLSGGNMVFNGTTHTVTGSKPILTAVTLEFHLQLVGNASSGYPHIMMYGNTFIGFVGNTTSARFRVSINPGAGYSEINSELLNPSTNFNVYTLTYDGVTARIYVNGVKQTSTMNIASTFVLMNGSTYTIAQNGVGYDMAAINVSNFKIYNRALADNEVIQNFNAIRGRYGI